MQKHECLQAFDGATARAVAELRVLVELSLPFIRSGGCLIAAKGPSPQVGNAILSISFLASTFFPFSLPSIQAKMMQCTAEIS